MAARFLILVFLTCCRQHSALRRKIPAARGDGFDSFGSPGGGQPGALMTEDFRADPPETDAGHAVFAEPFKEVIDDEPVAEEPNPSLTGKNDDGEPNANSNTHKGEATPREETIAGETGPKALEMLSVMMDWWFQTLVSGCNWIGAEGIDHLPPGSRFYKFWRSHVQE